MTSVVAGGIFNAFAFAGAGNLFQKINRDGHSEEIKRHNLRSLPLQILSLRY